MRAKSKLPGIRRNRIIVCVACVAVCFVLQSCSTPRRERAEISEYQLRRTEEHYVKLSHGLTHYELAETKEAKRAPFGKRTAVVLVHGALGPMCIWDNQFRAMKEKGFRVLRYDMYGRGLSARPNADYNRKLFEGQLQEMLDFTCPGEKADLVGISMGGGTVIDFATHQPERVRRIVLIAPLIDGVRGMTVRRYIVRVPFVGNLLFRAIGVRSAVKQSIASLKPAESCESSLVDQTTYKGFEKALLSLLRGDALGDYTQAYQAVGKQEGKEVLLIWGTADETISESMIQQVKETIPYVTEAKLDGVGHGAVFERPSEVNNLLIDFLGQPEL
jgi:pimeloyl-ACP methyl ester carboxylesterase